MAFDNPPSSEKLPDVPAHKTTDIVPLKVHDSAAANGDAANEIATWEDDETFATGFLRAACVLIIGLLLGWAQWKSPASPINENWNRWIATSVLFNFALPLGMVWMLFGQGVVHQDWLKDQKHNAWDYGWNWENWRKHLVIALVLWALMLPFIVYFSRLPDVRASYAYYLPPTTDALSWTWLLVSLTIYMFCWEWFFRGFGLFGIAQGWGPVASILIGAVLFGLAHTGKPPAEMMSAFGGGLVLGVLCWREKSFVPAFFTHALVHCSFAVLVKI